MSEWVDKGLYWAWYWGHEGYKPPPSKKEIAYERFNVAGVEMLCAATVDGVEVYADERSRLRGGADEIRP